MPSSPGDRTVTDFVASARMYGVAADAMPAWGRFFAHISAEADLPLEVVAHAFPAPLDDLWQRPDLGCTFMCGWPLMLEDAVRQESGQPLRRLIAVPVPDAVWSNGAAIYRSDFVVAATAPYQRLEDTFGTRFAFNTLSSHSGVNMPRAHLAQWVAQAPLFAEMVGPLTTVRRCLEAVADGAADITAVDSYALQMLAHHDPALYRQLRVIASSAPSSIPPLVCGDNLPDAALMRLRTALTGLHRQPAGPALLAELCLSRFVDIDRAAYTALSAVERQAQDAGYPVLG